MKAQTSVALLQLVLSAHADQDFYGYDYPLLQQYLHPDMHGYYSGYYDWGYPGDQIDHMSHWDHFDHDDHHFGGDYYEAADPYLHQIQHHYDHQDHDYRGFWADYMAEHYLHDTIHHDDYLRLGHHQHAQHHEASHHEDHDLGHHDLGHLDHHGSDHHDLHPATSHHHTFLHLQHGDFNYHDENEEHYHDFTNQHSDSLHEAIQHPHYPYSIDDFYPRDYRHEDRHYDTPDYYHGYDGYGYPHQHDYLAHHGDIGHDIDENFPHYGQYRYHHGMHHSGHGHNVVPHHGHVGYGYGYQAHPYGAHNTAFNKANAYRPRYGM